MHHWLKFPSNDRPLVANLPCTRVYDSRHFLGKLWKPFHAQDRLTIAVRHVNNVFHQEIANIRQPLRQYQNYLKKKGNGYDVNEEDLFQARKLITQWNTSTKPFLKLFENPATQQRFFQKTGISPAPLFYSTYNYDLYSCQKIIDLEGLTNGPLPVQVFKKIIKEIPLNAIDQKELDRWIVKIEKNNIEPQPIHKALKYLAEVYSKANTTEIDKSLVRLELFLEDKGCTAFKKDDPKHLQWRQSLEKSKAISFNSSTLMLEHEIYPSIFGSDQTRAYTIENHPDQIALIAHNRIALPLRQRRMQINKHPDMDPVQFSGISSDGRVAIVERLKPLNSIDWTCPGGTFNEEERTIIGSLTAFIQQMISRNYTPLHFSSHSLMLDKNMQLKFVKPMSKGDFDFTSIEDFISNCAAGNSFVFKELMTKSGLINHPIAKYYKDIVQNTLKGDTTAPDDLAGIYRIGNPKVVDRALVIIEQVKEKKNQFLMNLRKSSPTTQPAQLEALANKTLYESYLKSDSISKFCPTLSL